MGRVLGAKAELISNSDLAVFVQKGLKMEKDLRIAPAHLLKNKDGGVLEPLTVHILLEGYQ